MDNSEAPSGASLSAPQPHAEPGKPPASESRPKSRVSIPGDDHCEKKVDDSSACNTASASVTQNVLPAVSNTEDGKGDLKVKVEQSSQNSSQERMGSGSGPKSRPKSEGSDYESEPASTDVYLQRKRNKKSQLQQTNGKTFYPRTRTSSVSREIRELTRKHAILEKNLKIDGMPEPPKIRKRRMSLGSNSGRDKDSPFKRKRLASVDFRPKRDHMPKWGLFGGDATDPLNLNGLATSEEGRLLNLKTPENSPLPTPYFRKIVYVKVPPNIEDPLNLEGKHDQRYIDMLLNSKSKKRHRSRKKGEAQSNSKEPGKAESESQPTMSNASESETDSKEKNSEISSTKLSKPIEEATPKPQPTSISRSRSRSVSMSPDRKLKRQLIDIKGKSRCHEPKKFPEKPMFTLGNYNRYYGYRNREHEPDPRLRFFDGSWFEGKDVLDIGCNVGHVTLALAEHYHPNKILGMDIDGKLIKAARQNIRHMLSLRRKDSSKYPSVFEITRGPLEAHPLMGSSDQFPNNVLFLQGNYVPGSEEILTLVKEEYDTILALSITKWIHLNNGDHGLKLFFQKIYKQLRPGGRLILEPQPWSTYRKRAKLTPELFKNYSEIKLKPEGFKRYLLSLGFVKCEVIGLPVTKAKGFRRPLILFTKGGGQDSSSAATAHALGSFPPCIECADQHLGECSHIQFTGMRRGPYASALYDRISYNCTSMNRSSASGHSNGSFPSPSYPNVPVQQLLDTNVLPLPPDMSEPPSSSLLLPGAVNYEPAVSASDTASGSVSGTASNSCSSSERSCSSSGTQGTGSSQSSSYYSSSSPSNCGAQGNDANRHYAPENDGSANFPVGENVVLNGDAAMEIEWIANNDNDAANGDDDNAIPIENGDVSSGENGQIVNGVISD